MKTILLNFSLACLFILNGCNQQNDRDYENSVSDIQKRKSTDTDKAIIGNLGGLPVRLPQYVELVQYDDSPDFDQDKLHESFPHRTFNSKLMDFGYYYNHETNEPKNRNNIEKYQNDKDKAGNPWVYVGVQSGKMYLKRETAWDDSLSNELEKGVYLYQPYTKLPEKQYNLDVYVQLGTNSKDNKPWRVHHDAQDFFVYRDKHGHVRSKIRCSNNITVPNPPCKHRFIMTNDMKVIVNLLYNRQQLHHWKKMEQQVETQLRSFVVKLEHS